MSIESSFCTDLAILFQFVNLHYWNTRTLKRFCRDVSPFIAVRRRNPSGPQEFQQEANIPMPPGAAIHLAACFRTHENQPRTRNLSAFQDLPWLRMRRLRHELHLGNFGMSPIDSFFGCLEPATATNQKAAKHQACRMNTIWKCREYRFFDSLSWPQEDGNVVVSMPITLADDVAGET